MKLHTIYNKTLALTALMIIASPMHAFLDIKALWNSFKQNTGAQVAVGAACTAAVASLGWMLYKRTYSKPVAITSSHSSKGPKKDARWNNAAKPQIYTWGQVARQHGIPVPRKLDDLIETHDTPQRFAEVPAPILVSAATSNKDHIDRKYLSEEQRRNAEAYKAATAPIKNNAEARDAAKQAIGNILHRVEQEASRNEGAKAEIERNNQRLDKLAQEITQKALADAKREHLLDIVAEQTLIDATEKAVFELCQEVSGEKAARFIDNKTKLLLALEKQLQEKEYSEAQIDKMLTILNGSREEIFSFYSKGDNLEASYTANFEKLAHVIKPKEAYQALITWKILNEEEARDKAAKVPTAAINQRLNELAEKAAHNSDTQFVYRQLGYIFRNEITRDKYNNWIDGLPPVTLDSKVQKDLVALCMHVQSIALDKKEASNKKSSQDKEYLMVERPLITSAVSIVGKKEDSEKVDRKTAQERYEKAAKQLKSAANATASAASQVVSIASNATAAAYSAVASATTAAYNAGVTLLNRTPSPAQDTSASAKASADAKAMADKTVDKMAGKPAQSAAAVAEVDPLSAAPVPENHLQAGPAKAPVMINAGPSIALTVTPSAAGTAQSPSAGASTESLQAEPQSKAIDRSYDMLESHEDLTHGGIVRVAQPMHRPSGASGGASA